MAVNKVANILSSLSPFLLLSFSLYSYLLLSISNFLLCPPLPSSLPLSSSFSLSLISTSLSFFSILLVSPSISPFSSLPLSSSLSHSTPPLPLSLSLTQGCRVSRMVFLGAVDYQALKTECIKRDQVSYDSTVIYNVYIHVYNMFDTYPTVIYTMSFSLTHAHIVRFRFGRQNIVLSDYGC